MDLQGIRTTVNKTLTGDDRRGVRRSKPLSTLLQAAVKPRNTSIAKLPPNTQVSPKDLNASYAEGTTASQHDRLVKQTQTWVAQTFFGTLMKQMRESPFKNDLLDGGRGGQAFSELYDQHLSERMSRGAGSHLVNSIVHRIEARAAAVKQQVELGRKAA